MIRGTEPVSLAVHSHLLPECPYFLHSSMHLLLFFHHADDADLRNAVANLVAAVMGMPAYSSHLWAHMFDIKSLPGTFMTGNMVGNMRGHHCCVCHSL